MRAAVVAMLLLAAQPALACHRYSTWRYPWPQRCGVVRHAGPEPPSEEQLQTLRAYAIAAIEYREAVDKLTAGLTAKIREEASYEH